MIVKDPTMLFISLLIRYNQSCMLFICFPIFDCDYVNAIVLLCE